LSRLLKSEETVLHKNIQQDLLKASPRKRPHLREVASAHCHEPIPTTVKQKEKDMVRGSRIQRDGYVLIPSRAKVN
jgi:hypothetical protein